MTPTEVGLLVGAVVGLFGALQAWLVSKTVSHESQLNGLMTDRIAVGANTAIVADHAVRAEAATALMDPATMARISLLKAEMSKLDPTYDGR